ncbi:hypothetical protein AB1Y20_010490 [Prymnesium parvum]|uniref:Hydroxyproline O-arabinosyltransferase-like domain-containing protein n=1 Tax=Prymnesium parvum TaxID=97485 RepID=A0AB34IPP0_PRYPA
MGLLAALLVAVVVGALVCVVSQQLATSHLFIDELAHLRSHALRASTALRDEQPASSRDSPPPPLPPHLSAHPRELRAQTPSPTAASRATTLAAELARPFHRPPRPPAEAVGAASSECAQRQPYHVLLTAASGVYQEWQTRIAYYHYKKLKALHPCSDVGGFTRLLNTRGAQPDGLMAEIPTVLVNQLHPGGCDECDHGFIVMNRPWGLQQLVSSDAFERIEEKYLFIMETDHIMLKPLRNAATPTRPVAFGFFYMTHRYDTQKLYPVVKKYFDPDQLDPVGPSPMIIAKDCLRRLVPSWWNLTLAMKRDQTTDRALGWVLEMWSYTINAAKLGVRHQVERYLQSEPAEDRVVDLTPYYLLHYTFDLHYQSWKFSKRRFGAQYPPAEIPSPPTRAPRNAHAFVRMMNEAMGATIPWKACKDGGCGVKHGDRTALDRPQSTARVRMDRAALVRAGRLLGF